MVLCFEWLGKHGWLVLGITAELPAPRSAAASQCRPSTLTGRVTCVCNNQRASEAPSRTVESKPLSPRLSWAAGGAVLHWRHGSGSLNQGASRSRAGTRWRDRQDHQRRRLRSSCGPRPSWNGYRPRLPPSMTWSSLDADYAICLTARGEVASSGAMTAVNSR
jgi:hypothetical protein